MIKIKGIQDMKISIKALNIVLSLFFVAGCASGGKELKREPNALFNFKDVRCEFMGKNISLKKEYALETRWFSTEKDLLVIDEESGLKGVYFDISGTGGFTLYFAENTYIMESEIEGLGIQETKKSEVLPIELSLRTTSEIFIKKELKTMHHFNVKCVKSRGFRF